MNIATLSARVLHQLVWRCDFSQPGFCVVELDEGADSKSLRAAMANIKEQLSSVAVSAGDLPFIYKSLVRSDQQETTKFHLDGAPPASLLMLGYEPSRVASRLLLADYSRCALDMGMEPAEFLARHNPMYQQTEALLENYVVELLPAHETKPRIVIINNSCMPISSTRQNPLGVLHKAEIVHPLPNEHRIVNSIMLAPGEHEELPPEQIEEFLTTNWISPKVYA